MLPRAADLLPYLARIDESRRYTNHGSLMRELESRLAHILGLGPGNVVAASSGTAALVGAILAHAGRARAERPLAVVPSFTFVATALAAEECGYIPFIADVDGKTWILDGKRLLDEVPLDRVGVVIPAAPFGKIVPLDEWQAFSERTGIPVVIDGAACFDLLVADSRNIGQIPIALSLHATKSFSTCEGGAVIAPDADLAKRITTALNFGFCGERECIAPSINGKMSEYHAAVGLAELDGWKTKTKALWKVAERYMGAVAAPEVARCIVAAPQISCSYVLFRASSTETAKAKEVLELDNVDTRWWYGRGIQHHPYFATALCGELHVAEELAPTLLGLPIACDLSNGEIDRVVTGLGKALRGDS
jgi:dTDP-4-amino-4,6-dideoxygalactose transaminase